MDFIILFSSTEVSSREGVEIDAFLLVSVYRKRVEGVLVMIDHYSQIAVCEFLICPLPMNDQA